MSDDEDVIPAKKTKQVHYGSLEEQEKARLAALAAAVRDGVEDSGGKELGDIQISNGKFKPVYLYESAGKSTLSLGFILYQSAYPSTRHGSPLRLFSPNRLFSVLNSP